MTAPAKPILLTGASGNLGRVLARHLAQQGMTLRLTDIAPFPDEVPAGASFTRADLADGRPRDPAAGRGLRRHRPLRRHLGRAAV